jgi:hypothetical protein
MVRKSLNIGCENILSRVNRYCVLGDVLLKRGKYTDETRMVLEKVLAEYRQHPAVYASNIEGQLKRLARFHHHVSDTMPPGEERDREEQLRDDYLLEMDALTVIEE